MAALGRKIYVSAAGWQKIQETGLRWDFWEGLVKVRRGSKGVKTLVDGKRPSAAKSMIELSRSGNCIAMHAVSTLSFTVTLTIDLTIDYCTCITMILIY
jgi:hypothetical protein